MARNRKIIDYKLLFPVLFSISVVLGNYISILFYLMAIIIVCVECSLNDIEQSFCFSLFLIPNIRTLDNVGITYLVNILVVIPLIKYIFVKKFHINRNVLIGTTLFFVIELFHTLLLDNFSNLAPTICWSLSMLLCLSILVDNTVNVNKKYVAFYMSFGCIASALTYLFNNIDFLDNIVLKVINGERFAAYADDPNYFSLYICLSIAMLLSIENKERYYYVFLAFLLVFGFLTTSKMCYLLIAFELLLAILIQLVSKDTMKKNHRFMATLSLLITSAFAIGRDMIFKLFNNFLYRLGINGNGSININKATTGRFELLANYCHILNENSIALILGYGFQYQLYLGEHSGRPSHNTYFDVLLSWGVLGTIAFIGVVSIILKDYFQKFSVRNRLIDYLPIMVLTINFLDLSCFNSTMFWWVLVAALLSIRRDDFLQLESSNSPSFANIV